MPGPFKYVYNEKILKSDECGVLLKRGTENKMENGTERKM